jgi:hypothetical protein
LHTGAANHLILLLLAARAVADKLPLLTISMTISALSPKITFIVETTIYNPMLSFFGNHSGKPWASYQQKIHSLETWETSSWQHK